MMDAVRAIDRRNVDEVMILDITATPKKRGPRSEEINKFTSELFCPVIVGGGVRTVDDEIDLLKAGAEKVAICTGAFDEGKLIEDAAKRIGSRSVVGVVDVCCDWVVSHCGLVDREILALDWAAQLEPGSLSSLTSIMMAPCRDTTSN